MSEFYIKRKSNSELLKSLNYNMTLQIKEILLIINLSNKHTDNDDDDDEINIKINVKI